MTNKYRSVGREPQVKVRFMGFLFPTELSLETDRGCSDNGLNPNLVHVQTFHFSVNIQTKKMHEILPCNFTTIINSLPVPPVNVPKSPLYFNLYWQMYNFGP